MMNYGWYTSLFVASSCTTLYHYKPADAIFSAPNKSIFLNIILTILIEI